MQLKKFSPAAQKILIQSRVIAKKNHSQSVEPEHLALALIMTAELKELLEKKNVEHKALEQALLKLISNMPIVETEDPTFSIRLIQALGAADALSIKKRHDNIFVSDLFLSLVENRDKYGALGALLGGYFLDEEVKATKKTFITKDEEKSLLLSVSDNVSFLIKNHQLDPVFGREKEIERLVQVLSRKSQNNPILIGEPGVGRTSIVYALVKRINDQKVPSHLVSKEVLALDISALVSGTTLRGQFEEKMRALLSELALKKGHYILFIRDLSLLAGAGGEGASDAANLLKPSLSRGLVQLIGLVTPDAYKKRIESDPSFERYFQPIWISAPSEKECLLILSGLRDKYEQFHGVFIEDDALLAAIELGGRHLAGRVLPELALDILDEACSRHRVLVDMRPTPLIELSESITETESARKLSKEKDEKKSAKLLKLKTLYKEKTESYQRELSIIESMRAIKGELIELKSLGDKISSDGKSVEDLEAEFKKRRDELLSIKKSDRLVDPWVKRDDIAAVISQETGIPMKKMLESEREKLSHMETLLSAHVIGQEEAIFAVANAIRRARVGLKDLKRPIGSFLFLGPTGVGKTELARALTNFLFDDERAMIRFDMSEFMERHTVARMIGAPPGYQGSEEGGQLTEKVRRKPYSVVLFDEIEKAHSDVLNVLLQVLDDGRLTDSKGHMVLFSNTVIIMTSNVGADILLREDLTPDKALQKNLIMERLLIHLRPEFINRIDEIVIFNAIDRKGIIGIADLMLKNMTTRLEKEGYFLAISPEVKEMLIKEGYSREFGARPLKRTIQRLLENPLAMSIVNGNFKKGDAIETTVESGRIVFKKVS